MSFDEKLRRISAWSGLLTVAAGGIVLAGWITGVHLFANLTPSVPPLKPDAAICLLLIGASLWLQLRPGVKTQRAGVFCAVAALVIAVVVLLLRWYALDLGFHRGLSWLLGYGGDESGLRMSLHAALMLAGAATALVMLGQNQRRDCCPVAVWLANLVIGFSAAALVAVEFGQSTAFTQPLRVSSHLSVVLLILGVGILLARPEDRNLQIIFSRSREGVLARRLLLAVTVAPLAFGLVAAWLSRHHYLSVVDAVVLFAVAMIASGFGIALFSLNSAAALSAQREQSDASLRDLQERVQAQTVSVQETIDERMRALRDENAGLHAAADSNALVALATRHAANPVIITDAEGAIVWVNPAFSRVTGYAFDEVKGRKPGKVLQGPDTDPAAIARLRDAEHVGQPCRVEILHYTRQGTPYWQLLDLQPVRDAAGKLTHFVTHHTDITGQRADRVRLEHLNRRLELASRAGGIGVWEWDAITQRCFWDQCTLEIYGVRPEEFTGTREEWINRLHPDERESAVARIVAAMARGDHYEHEFRIIRASDGAERVVQTRGLIERDSTGRVRRIIGTERDVTTEREAAQKTAAVTERLRLALRSSNYGVWEVDLATGRRHWDDRILEMFGLTRETFDPDRPVWLERVHPDDRAAAAENMRRVIAGELADYAIVFRIVRADGAIRYLESQGYLQRDARGQPVRLVGLSRDITEGKELEQRLEKSEQLAREVSRIARIGGWELDLVGRRVTWTEGTRRLHEVDDSFQPSMASMWQFFPPDVLPKVQAAFNDASPSSPTFELEVPMLTARGRRLWVRILGHGEFHQGAAVSVHGAIQDVTVQHEGEEARRQLEMQLFQAQKMETLGTLAGGIAHDFNNLLTGIIGYHELAADILPEDHPSRQCLNEARNASMRARALVEQILTFGRQSRSAQLEPIELGPVVDEARRFLRSTLPANIAIEVNCAPNCGTVAADATQIHQVMLNLGSNAAHAMRENGGTLRITLEPWEVSPDLAITLGSTPAASYVRLSVSDDGHGMDEATRRRIFDPFFTTKNTREGTGLGLAVVHGIIRGHRGAIDVESAPGRGATFHIYLPAVGQPKEAAGAGPGSAPLGSGEYVCVVDDEEVVGSCTKLVLENKGYHTLVFTSGEACLAEVQSNPARCTVLVTDQTMPGMSGTELAAALRQLRPGLPVVIMSGYFSKISPQILDDLGQVELLGKPFTTDELLHAVHRALHPAAKGA
ncbi:MAG: PAS domain-containing protein [Opitutaceae bacterium]|nr:PAS domain-containing protein [Opitutaceae bacterium]